MLARFHAIAGEFQSTFGPAPAIADRLRLFAASAGGGLAAVEQAMQCPLDSEIDVRCHKLLTAARALLERDDLVKALSQTGSLPLIPAIRDIHRDHVLFEGNEVTGLIDFGALRLDTPLTDVARLLGSLVGDDLDAQSRSLEAYAEIRELTPVDLKRINLFDTATILGSALNWLRWLYLEHLDMGLVAVVAPRLDGILRRLEARIS
jgi:homoserine kinase type II